MQSVTITTDGSCEPNPGPGGWAAIIRFDASNIIEVAGYELATTNNRMELRAVIEALRALPYPCSVTIRTDSRNTMSWCAPHAFTKLAQRLRLPEAYALVLWFRSVSARHKVEFQWVRGHAGDADNERCDVLANLHRITKTELRQVLCAAPAQTSVSVPSLP